MKDLTTGSLTRHLLTTMGFMLVGMVMQTMYVLVDLYWVGRLGTEAVAAAALGGNVTFIVLAASQALGVGTTALIAQAAGRKDQKAAQEIFAQSQLLALIAGVVFLVVSWLTRDLYVTALAPDAQTVVYAREFLGWFLPAMALQFGLVAMGSALRGTGRFKPGMYVHAGSVVINMALAPVFMFGLGPFEPMGIAGTALATFVGVLVGVIAMALYFLPSGAYIRLSHLSLTPDFARWKALLKIGVPAGTEFALLAVYLFVVYAVTRRFGAAAQAGFGIGMRILQSGFLPVVALGFAVAPVAGQNYGAGKHDRVKATFRDAAGLAVGMMFIFSLVVHFAPEVLISPFSTDPAVLASAAEYLRIVSWSFVASGVVYVSSSVFQAVGNSVPPLIASLIRTALAILPLWILTGVTGFALHWVWWLSVASVTVQVTLNLWLLRCEFRSRLAHVPA